MLAYRQLGADAPVTWGHLRLNLTCVVVQEEGDGAAEESFCSISTVGWHTDMVIEYVVGMISYVEGALFFFLFTFFFSFLFLHMYE